MDMNLREECKDFSEFFRQLGNVIEERDDLLAVLETEAEIKADLRKRLARYEPENPAQG